MISKASEKKGISFLKRNLVEKKFSITNLVTTITVKSNFEALGSTIGLKIRRTNGYRDMADFVFFLYIHKV